MSRRIQLFTILFFSFLYLSNLHAQWKQLNVGQPGLIQAVACLDGKVFAGTMAGIYRSTDDGASWTNVSTVFAYCFASEGSEIYAGTYQNGVVCSTDGGLTWTQPDTGFNNWILSLAIKDSVIIAGGTGIFRSADNGHTWTPIGNGLKGSVTGLAIDGNELFATTYSGLMMSTDNGNSWTGLVANGLPSGMTNCVAAYDSVVLVGSPGGLSRSGDYGKTWTSPDVLSSAVLSAVVDSSYSYVGTTSGVRVSTDGGTTWEDASNALPGNQVWALAVDGTDLFAGSNNSGVFHSTDNGTTWLLATSGIISSQVNSISGIGADIYTVMDYNSIFTSTDYGATWSADTSLHSGPIQSVTVIGSKVYATTNTGLFVSSDNGATWDSLNGGVLGTSHPAILAQSGSNLIVACQDSGQVFVSSDSGVSWTNIGSDLPEIASMTSFGSSILAGTHDGMYLSTDEGKTWKNVNDTLININAMVTLGADVFAARYMWPFPIGFASPSPPGGIFRSTDGGFAWSAISSGISWNPQVTSLVASGSNLFVGLKDEPYYSGSFYSSPIAGNHWVNMGDGLPGSSVTSLYINDSDVYVGTQAGGLWRAAISQVTAIKPPQIQSLPSEFHLSQNYPNPFNPSTTISYDIPKRSHVLVSIYDVLGREVRTLVDEKEAPGTYKVLFDASSLPSGVYFYRISAGNFVETKKCLVIK
ncbi:MAG: T9SS type A sorting domain-containing protein [Bacteroidetes bacterium]|nr:T9SS type A sorting domain-containing protein [Bacteroidota bacterium]